MPGQSDQLRVRKAIVSARNNAYISLHSHHTRNDQINAPTGRLSTRYCLQAEGLEVFSQRPPTILTPVEEAGLVAYVVWLERSGFPADKRQVEEAAREIRSRRGLENIDFSKHWYRRFRERHLELKKTFIKAVDKSHKSFEAADIEDVRTYFENLQHVILRY
ncbi:hypothetical protein CEP51_015472 [Fusarium floridanum]|uniref:HTH CENPB-type domain-containing protein n=1 Tax=Fusarium floridanum TaxID=1325733 RepID=A0A428P964_9HYPO|nr:hypothetical protein CEP51_015472 [Fusarium floridanum]